MTKEFKSAEIESALQQLMQQKNVCVTVESICDFLGADASKDEFNERLNHFLLGDESLYTVDGEHFYRRSDFFNGRKFVVAPTEYEIEKNILIIGHRFQTFMDPEVFPSDLVVKYGRKNIGKKIISESLQELFPYHMLMGAEQISDFFIGEHEENAKWTPQSGYGYKMHLNVLDMADFYNTEDMKFEDALLFTVQDYNKGSFKISKLAKLDRSEENIIKWCRDFEDKVGDVADRFETYLDLPEQLRMAFFIGGDEFFGEQGASLDEFIRTAEAVEIVFDTDHTVMVRKDDASEFNDSVDIPDGISISGGESSSLQAILKAVGSSLSEIEINSYILESCFDRDKDFDAFLNKVFDFEKLSFTDEAQKTVFLNFLEDRFEQLSEKYSRFNDEDKAPLRSRILELVTARNDFFNYLRTLDIDEKNIPQKEMKKIAEGTMNINSILQMLNDERHDIGEEEKDAIFEAIESAEDILNDSMEAVEIALKI